MIITIKMIIIIMITIIMRIITIVIPIIIKITIIILIIRRTNGAGRVRPSVSKPLSFLVVSFLAC